MDTDLESQPLLEAISGTGLGEHQPTVLLVEDDENTLFAIEKLLTRAGYLVLTAGSGHDAICKLEQPLSPIDVVVLDVRLPDVQGAAIGARMRELKPGLPIVVCSGEAGLDEVAALVRLGRVRYFRKPVRADELLAAVDLEGMSSTPSGNQAGPA